jgi:hypothetical protein
MRRNIQSQHRFDGLPTSGPESNIRVVPEVGFSAARETVLQPPQEPLSTAMTMFHTDRRSLCPQKHANRTDTSASSFLLGPDCTVSLQGRSGDALQVNDGL